MVGDPNAPSRTTGPGSPDPSILLERMGLGATISGARFTALSGGVSSDIWLVDSLSGQLILKRPRHQLDVERTWVVPVDRGQAEVDWLRCVGQFFPDNVPRVLAYDPDTFATALTYFPPDTHTNWKTSLMAGNVDSGFAGRLGQLLGDIHSATYARPHLAADFDNDDLFYLLRIEPFLERVGQVVPEVGGAIARLNDSLRSTSLALVHGDFSPKNILVGNTPSLSRPIVLDAECAVWGDPAFDVAFCLTHLALKSIHVSGASEKIIDAAAQFRAAYFDACPGDIAAGIFERLGELIPALLLARVVGSSPAGYLSQEEESLVTHAAVTSLVSGDPCGPLLHPKKGLSESPW